MSTLSKRLRGGANLPRKPAGLSREDLYEAADELDRLTARVAELKGALAEFRNALRKHPPHYWTEALTAADLRATAALEHKHD